MMEPILKIFPNQMANNKYQVEVWEYAFKQFRIQLQIPTEGEYGDIIRQCCTYNAHKAVSTLKALKESADPEAYLESLATPHNCEGPGGRIRLDTTEKDNPFRQHQIKQRT